MEEQHQKGYNQPKGNEDTTVSLNFLRLHQFPDILGCTT